jgi:hypothetical protein
MDRHEADLPMPEDQPVSRRCLLQGVGAGSLAVSAGGLLAACSSGLKGGGSASTSGTINIGFITPLTGQLSGFASGDRYVLSQILQSSTYKSGIKIGSKTYKININTQAASPAPRGPARSLSSSSPKTTST